MKKTLLAIAAVLAMAATATPALAGKYADERTVVAVYAGDFIRAGTDIMVRVETVASRKSVAHTKVYMREADIPAELLAASKSADDKAQAVAAK